MRALIQRVSSASVIISGREHAAIGRGLLVLLGVGNGDGNEDLAWLSRKIASMRIFDDGTGHMQHDVKQANGDILVISQFTLHASTKKGNRPSFTEAAPPGEAERLYGQFIVTLSTDAGRPCRTGVFGANMQVQLVNDGPVTIWLDSRQRS